MESEEGLSKFGIEISNPVWRVSLKKREPFMPPPAHIQVHGRFDDPMDPSANSQELYSVLYGAQTPGAALIESMAGLRPRLGAVEELISQTMLTVEEREAATKVQLAAGMVTSNWLDANHLTSGEIGLVAPVFNLANAEAVQTVRFYLAPSLIAMGLDDLDFGELLGTNRTLTQAISRWLWTLEVDPGKPMFSGIRYRSRFDPECICLALYQDRYKVSDTNTQPITPETQGFAEAAATLHLKIS